MLHIQGPIRTKPNARNQGGYQATFKNTIQGGDSQDVRKYFSCFEALQVPLHATQFSNVAHTRSQKTGPKTEEIQKYFITSKKVEVKRTQLNPAIEKGCSSVACNQ